MGGYKHRKRDKLEKFHEFATNVRRLRLESPRGDFVGGCNGLLRDRNGIGPCRWQNRDYPAKILGYSWWSTLEYAIVGCICSLLSKQLNHDPTGDSREGTARM